MTIIDGLGGQMPCTRMDPIRPGRLPAGSHDQDLVYSVGLIGYLRDEVVVRLITLVHGMCGLVAGSSSAPSAPQPKPGS